MAAHEIDVNDMRRPRVGEVDAWIRWGVGAAAIVTFLIAIIAPRMLVVRSMYQELDSFWFRNTLAIGVAIVISLACLPVLQVSRSVRLAVLLPITHLVLLGVTWFAWTVFAPELGAVADLSPVLEEVPLSAMLAGVAVPIAVAGWWIARTRRGETRHAIVMLALVNLLLLSVWVPIASRLVTGPSRSIYDFESSVRSVYHWERMLAMLAHPAKLLAIVVVPPLALATAYTWIAFRRRAWMIGKRGILIAAVTIAWLVATVLRLGATEYAIVIYSNAMPLILASALVAVAAIIALSIGGWRATRSTRAGTAWRQLVGRIAEERGALVAGFEIASWLRGPRAVVDGFEVTTATGSVPVPPGAELVAPLSLATTLLRTGETIAVLRGGDAIAIGGFEQHASGQPFRDSTAPIAGGDGVIVGPEVHAPGGAEQLALIAWRPCVAYLVILVLAAVPALITLTRQH